MRHRAGVRFARSAPATLPGVAGPFPASTTPPNRRVLLTELLTPERVKVPLAARSKEAVLEELVGVLAQAGVVADPAAVLRAVHRREDELTTAIGGGVAIPHGKVEGVGELVMAAGIASEPIDFAALDGQPVRLFFLLAGPESAAGLHVKALSRISRLVRRDDLRERLAAAATPDEFMAVVSEAESA
jgi:PTS system fructose-specific IIC component